MTKCPDCGALLADTAQSLCPGCLIRLGITLNRPVPSQPGTGSRDDHRPSAPDPGTLPIRFGNYELLEQLASGGMGVVYKARQLSLNRVVALKMIRAGALAGPAEVKRFHSEAEAVAQLQHRHIVSIHDIGECDGQHYFSMDYIAGRTLAEVVREGPLPVHRAAGYVRAIAEAIHYAHQHGIVHRDLKPANVLLDEQDQPWITDFGLAKRLGDSVLCAPDSLLTLSGQVLGSPNYLAPEQADPKRGIVGPTSDIYALGAILYHLVTGRPPFQAESLTTLLREVIETEPIAPRLLNPSLPHDLETILLKCLEKAPGRRYATAQALADELDRLLRHEPIRARPVSWPERIWRWCQRWPVRASLASGLIGAILMGVTGIAWQWYRAEGALQLAVRAEGKAEERLWASYLAQGRANRWSNRPGRRFEGLEAVSNAAAIRPTLELRNEAIACLALPDVHMERILTVNRTQRKLALAYDARFERYAWIYVDGSIGIHQVKDDRELLRLPLQESPRFAGLQFSPDGQFLACWIQNGETNRVRVWDLSSSRLALSLPVKVRSWAYRPGTTQLAVAEGSGLIHLLDAASGLEVRQIQQAPISHIAFSPEGSRLIVSHALTPSVVLLDLERSEIVRKIQAPGGIGLMACSPDGRVLAGPCLDNRIYLWDLESERPPAILEGHTSAAIAVAFNRLGDMMASSGWDGMTRFWDTKLHRLLFSVPGGWVPIPFGANDLWLGIGSSDRETAVWRVDPARECRRLGLTSKVWEAQFTPDGQHLFTAETDGVRLWDVEANRLAEFLPLAQCRSVTIARDGLTLVASGWSGVRRYGLSSEKTTGAVRISPSEEISPLKRERACLSPDGATVLATGSAEADVLVVDLNHPQKTRRLLGHTGAAAVAASPDGRWFATATWGGTGVKIWSTQTWQPVRELEVRGNAVCHFSPQGRWLVTGSAEEYRLCKAGSWESELVIPRDRVDDMYGSMAFSADESTMAVLVGRSSPVKLLALPGGQELATFDTGPPLCFSSDGNLLATAGEDGASLFVWDLRLIQAQLRTMKLDWALPDSAKGL